MAISHADKTIENHVRPDGEGYLMQQLRNDVLTWVLL